MAAATVGVFDGVHVGHRRLIGRIVAHSACPIVVTFKQNPKRVLFPHEREYADILPLQEKLRIFEELGVERVVLIDFSEDFRRLSGEDFIRLMVEQGNVVFLAVGSNFRCGYRHQMDAAAVQRIAGGFGAACEIADPVEINGERVSSSTIRAALRVGDTEKARLFMGGALDDSPFLLPHGADGTVSSGAFKEPPPLLF